MSDWNDRNQRIIAEFRANEGRVGGGFEGAPMVLIHHVGRKSGTEYVIPLVYLPDGDDSIAATVEHVATRGSVIRVELATGKERTIEADLTREQLRDLALEKGQGVYVRPTALRVFETGDRAAE